MMRQRRHLFLSISLGVIACAVPRLASACGGFFCDNIDPVVQTAERILFEVSSHGTVCTTVEVQYEGTPSNFAWVVPVPEELDASAVETAPAGIFDELEEVAAPVFERGRGDLGQGAADGYEMGCDVSLRDTDDDFNFPAPDTSGVEVVGEAVVGPYAIELISAESGDNLANWLALNGYQIPLSAADPMDHYIERDLAFLGIKLQADVPAGPVDALRFCYSAPAPSIPIILTRIAASNAMELTVYVAGDGRFAPDGYEDLAFSYGDVEFVDDDENTDYRSRLRNATVGSESGRSFVTEQAAPIDTLDLAGTEVQSLLSDERYLSRFHTFIEPNAMIADPRFIPSGLGDVDNHHTLVPTEETDMPDDPQEHTPSAPLLGLGIVFGPLLVGGVRVTRRRRDRA